jgi:hypothetical protein
MLLHEAQQRQELESSTLVNPRVAAESICCSTQPPLAASGELQVAALLGETTQNQFHPCNVCATASQGFFITKVFHPNVSPSGEICVNVLKKDWTPDTALRHVFLVGAASRV